MERTFQRWLANQTKRQDAVGRLARVMQEVDIAYRPQRRKPAEHKDWVDLVIEQGEPEYVLAFNLAWAEYQAAKKAEVTT
jgi:hypothetical protein